MKYLYFFLSMLLAQTHTATGDWVQVYNNTCNSVYFVNQNFGMGCGTNGNIYLSSNGGNNWTAVNTGINSSLYDIILFSETTAITAGDYQTILRTTNGGQNWYTVLNNSTNYSIKAISIFNNGMALAFSISYIDPYYYKYLYKTTDYGSTWNIQQIYNTGNWMHFINMNTGWAYGTYFTGPPLNQYYLQVSRTVDGGSIWSVIEQGSGVSIVAGRIYFFDANFGLKHSYIGPMFYFSRSNNGGNNWASIPGLSKVIMCYFFLNLTTGWITGNNGLISRTVNGGASFEEQQTPIIDNFQKIFFINESTGWIAAGNSGIMKTTNGGVYTGIIKTEKEIPNEYILYQNYPNPFNPKTIINFQCTMYNSVSLKVYDVLGKEIATLVNEYLKPGKYEVEFDGTNYPNGIYYYSLTIINPDGTTSSGMNNQFPIDYSETKKMVLLK